MNIHSIIKNLIFPKICFGCRKVGSYLCSTCRKKIRVIRRDMCVYCARASFAGLTHPGCKRKNCIDGVKSLFFYDGRAKKIISTVKYRLVTDAIDELTGAIPKDKLAELSFFKKTPFASVLIPVPLHPARAARRGFNQSEKYAHFFSQVLHLPIWTGVSRVKNTKPQAHLTNAKERYQNIRGAFSINPNVNIRGMEAIIVDDVWTTGATAKELCRVLKKDGARAVYVLTLARVYR